MRLEEETISLDLEKQYPEVFKQYRDALRLLEELFEPLDKPVRIDKFQEVVIRHCARCVQILRSILLLGRFGQGLD